VKLKYFDASFSPFFLPSHYAFVDDSYPFMVLDYGVVMIKEARRID
jgi:hypothetical protein